MTNTKYTKEDLGKITWDEYGQILESLYSKISNHIQENDIKIDAVIPILRGSGVAGTYLAYKLNLLNILPVQFKYLTIDGKFELQNLTKLADSAFQLLESPTFLLVENNHCFGNTSKAAAEYLKKVTPNCKIIYATAVMDYSYQKMPNTKAVFYGRLSNETKELSVEEAQEKGISNKVNLFPWENEEEELAMLNEQEYKYN